MFIATINTPGYLPQDDEVHRFDTPAEAWTYLADERKREEDIDYDDPSHPDAFEYSETWSELTSNAELPDVLGTVYGDTPGYDGAHDLGCAYSVTAE